jgi:hypothetical protein
MASPTREKLMKHMMCQLELVHFQLCKQESLAEPGAYHAMSMMKSLRGLCYCKMCYRASTALGVLKTGSRPGRCCTVPGATTTIVSLRSRMGICRLCLELVSFYCGVVSGLDEHIASFLPVRESPCLSERRSSLHGGRPCACFCCAVIILCQR